MGHTGRLSRSSTRYCRPAPSGHPCTRLLETSREPALWSWPAGASEAPAVNRYYDPSSYQFLSIDPKVGTTLQPYAFVGGDPLNSEDPLGLSVFSAIGNFFYGRYHFNLPSEVIGRYQTRQFRHYTPYRSYLTVGGYRYIQKHVAESRLHWGEFENGIRTTLGRPRDIKERPDGSLRYSGPVAEIDSDSGRILRKLAFYVAISPTDGKVINAWTSSRPSRVSQEWSGGPWSG